MLYHDLLYGSVPITEPVLLDLLEAPAVQRLKGVLQHGISGLIGVTQPVTRFEHSVGAMLLVRRLDAPLIEQIAALLHDVSHTAFSHVIDYVFDRHGSQSYHEEAKESYLAASDLPARLAHHGYAWRDFLRDDLYPLLEQPAPALCADRVDYFLRDSYHLGLARMGEIAAALAHLVVYEGGMAVDDVAIARWLGYTYLRADDASWANFREVGLYMLAAEVITAGLRVGAIGDDDLWSTDAAVWAKLQASPDAGLQRQLQLISPRTTFVWDETAPTFRVSTKLRTLDPLVVEGGAARPLSALDAEFARARADYLARKRGAWPMRVVA